MPPLAPSGVRLYPCDSCQYTSRQPTFQVEGGDSEKKETVLDIEWTTDEAKVLPNSKKEKLPATPPKPATVAENEDSDDDIAIVGEVEAPPKKPAPPGMATVEIHLCFLFLGLESFPCVFFLLFVSGTS